jgi:hypothetical protein
LGLSAEQTTGLGDILETVVEAKTDSQVVKDSHCVTGIPDG